MDAVMRERVWARWVALYPSDEGADERMKDVLLDTYSGQALALRIAGEDFVEPLRTVAVDMADKMDARLTLLTDKGLRAALRHTL